VEDVYGARRGLEKELPFRANGLGEISGAGLATSFYDGALLQWQKSGEELFRRFVQSQIELWRFLGGRWEQYLKLLEQISQCRSLTELGELQSAFLSKFASDYLQEAGKLDGSVAEVARHAKPLDPPHQ
jgi:hypothetical protein